jgi:SAM-dependent methyltransferase
MKQLLVGCGDELTTLDIDPNTVPDVLWDLNRMPYPFGDNTFDEVHAYEVLEHTGEQGNVDFFFAQFYEFWRILKPNGVLAVSVPHHKSIWAWGDPGHCRVITSGSVVFLSQKEYKRQLGKTAMSDYTGLWKGDFELAFLQEQGENLAFVLRAIKEVE